MVGYQFGLGFDGFGETLFIRLGHQLVVLLSPANQQGVVGRILDKGMFERVIGFWKYATLVQKLAGHQLFQMLS